MTLSRRTLALLAVGTLCSAPLRGAEIELSRWRHLAPVQVEAVPGKGLAELSLPPAVFAGARPDLTDLRLVGASDKVVPYVLRVDEGEAGRSVSYEPVKVFNRVFVPRRHSAVTLDFGGRSPRTCIDVDTPGANFRRRVMVEASQDGQQWQVLRETAWIFRIGEREDQHDMNRVQLPENDFRYLRVTVFNASDDPEKVDVNQIRAWRVKATPPRTVGVEVLSTTVQQKPKERVTEIELDLGYENLPLHEITLSFRDENFLRRVEVRGRNRKTYTVLQHVEDAPPRKREVEEPWHSFARGTIYRFSGGGGAAESLTLLGPAPGAHRYRYLLLRIHNGDNTALEFTGVQVRRLEYFLAFQPSGDGPYRLYFGRPDADGPQYDLAHYVGRLRTEGVTEVGLGPVSANPAFAEKEERVPWSERHKWLLWAALIIVLLILGVLIFRQARKILPAEGEQG